MADEIIWFTTAAQSIKITDSATLKFEKSFTIEWMYPWRN